MTCSQCGLETPKKAAFCPNCGAALNDKSGTSRMQAPEPKEGRHVPEQELWTGSYSPKAMVGRFALSALLTIVAMVGASFVFPAGWVVVGVVAVLYFAYLGLLLLYWRLSIRYRLTTQRLLRDTGILSRTGDHLLVVNIDDVKVHQGWVERIFNVGAIYLVTMDAFTKMESGELPDMKGKGLLKMMGIENPRHVADLIDEVRRAERKRGALYTVDA